MNILHLGGDLMIKATAVRNPKLIKIPSHTPHCYLCETFMFLNSVYVVLQSEQEQSGLDFHLSLTECSELLFLLFLSAFKYCEVAWPQKVVQGISDIFVLF